ncbi:hypothetical protein LPJ73_007916 [Coemansia sp. RSA 2703]|nr:hypothetical protein LPJ73_007916 [Coemansia sp. RSA 2703]
MKTHWIIPLLITSVSAKATCNGHSSLCNRHYDKVSFACTHNAYSYEPPQAIGVINQERTIGQQLDDGVRAFMLDIVRPPLGSKSNMHLCHGSCSLIDKGPFEDGLVIFKDFLDRNPHDVVTFIIENVSGFSAEDVGAKFASVGIDKYAYVHNSKWPTLGEMIAKNKRLVVFLDDKADTSKVPYILPEWDYVIETPFANISPVSKFPCNQDRPRDGKPRDLLVMNHFAYNRLTVAGSHIDTPLTPEQVQERGYNSLKSLQQNVDTCRQVWKDRIPNFVTLDFYDIDDGAIFKIVDQINGV